MTSFKQLTKDGVVKRADAFKVRFADIVVDPTFNKRDGNERLVEHVQGIKQFILDGGQLPDLEVIPVDGGKVQVVDGHCRHAAYGLAIAEGMNIEWVAVKPFSGDDADRTARIATSNEGLKLTPLETARVYQSLRDQHGLGPEDIARKVHKTRQHVDQLLHLADASPQVQQMVADGTVSATEAIKVARTHGEHAADVLGQAARASGKVTAKTLKPWTPPAKMVAPLVDSVAGLAGSIPQDVRTALFWMESEHRLDSERVKIELPAAVLWSLLNQQADLDEARKADADKQRAKAESAAQEELVEEGAV
jgi:ParB-like chromosome segregation protein Spo0J